MKCHLRVFAGIIIFLGFWICPLGFAHPVQSGLTARRLMIIGSAGVVRPPKVLSDPQAANEAKSLLSFLVDLYGQKVLSGQQSMDDIVYIQSLIGKQPAIGVFDLMDYSPSRMEHGVNPTGQVESWIDWADSGGGIVSLSWHWNAPTDLVDEGEWPWWRGFYTQGTTFDIESVLAEPAGERYQLLLRDLDAIAVQLAKFQDAGLPVLWRPLHEASGGWFWWGAKGPGPFIELWRLMYDRFVNVHGLHHLIWVYTLGDADWYPGDDYVDIVGMDIYPDDPNSSLIGYWRDAQSRHEGTKLVALTESGILPNPDRMRENEVWWSWFSVWSGDFIRNVEPAFLAAVYNDEDVLTLDELMDWKHYPVHTSPPNCSIIWPWNSIKIPVGANLTVLADAEDADGTISKVEFFNGVCKLGEDTAAPYVFRWNQIPEGVYLLKARAADNSGLATTSSAVSLIVGSAAPLVPMRYEAEEAVSDGPVLRRDFSGYSGSGSMLFNASAGTGITFTVFSGQQGSFPLSIRYLIQADWGDKPNRILVNGQLIGTLCFVNTGGAWTEIKFGTIWLHAGSNTVRIEHDWGWMYVDCIELMLPGTIPYLDGDLNMDNSVNMDDLIILAVGWMNPYEMEDLADVSADWQN